MRRRSLFLLYLALALTLLAPLLILVHSPQRLALVPPLHLDEVLLWGLIVGFPLVLVVVIHRVQRINKSIESLRLFVDSAERGLVDYDHIHFPEGELGTMGRKIVETYRRAEQNRLAAHREREKKRAYKQQISNNITHELRTPVAAIQGYLETLVRHPQLDAERQQQFVQRAYLQSQRLAVLIRDVSLITKMEEAPQLVPRESIDLCEVVTDVAADLEEACHAHSLQLCRLLPPCLPLMGNYSLLYALLRNLIENSLKYAAPCECTLSLTEATTTHLHLSYRDTGRGVPEEHLPRLFERFYRPDEGRTRTTIDEGSGLGLSIVRNAVIFHGGRISVSNHPEGGLMFDFTLRRN